MPTGSSRPRLGGTVESESGKLLDIPADSICIHGDTPKIVELLEAIHASLEEIDVELAPLPDKI